MNNLIIIMDALGKEELVDEAVRRFGLCYEEILMPVEIVRIYDAIQPDNEITLKQVEAALIQVVDSEFCDKAEVMDVLHDLDRRNFLLRDLKWEFELLDYERCGTLPHERAWFLFSAVRGKNSKGIWDKFVAERLVPGSRISFDELSPFLCDLVESEDSAIHA